jgi:death-on-curing protein
LQKSSNAVAKHSGGWLIGKRHYRLTLSDAIEAHDEALSFGGRDGIVSLHLIESALGRAYTGYHRSISRKAAIILHGVVSNHGFVDGNKRTAWILVELLIARSGYMLNISDDEPVDDLVVGVASGVVSLENLQTWFADRLLRE